MKNPVKELKNIDADGNEWKITLTPMDTKTNRFQLSFWFNHKEFSLSKLQSNRTADDIWELIQTISKSPSKVKAVAKPVSTPQPVKQPIVVKPATSTANQKDRPFKRSSLR